MQSIDRQALSRKINKFITTCNLDAFGGSAALEQEMAFQALALQLYAYQFQANPPYRKLCSHRAVKPGDISKWQDIPAVMTSSFKYAPLFCGEAEKEASTVFHTSGTTLSTPGKHYFKSTALYEVASMRFFKWAVLPDFTRLPVLILGPTAAHFPYSSLGQMFSWIYKRYGEASSKVCFSPPGYDFDAAANWLHQHGKTQPILILATSLALLDFIEFCEKRSVHFQLPEGSRVLDTGGYKGSQREIMRAELRQRTANTLGILSEWLFNEYGMTELSSQFYQSIFTSERISRPDKVAPPWLRSIACDPETLAALPEGEAGVLRHCDLANLDSVAMLQTEDIGIVRGRSIELLGRDPKAEPRGCSLLADELRQSQNS